jgi:hypothetical protein
MHENDVSHGPTLEGHFISRGSPVSPQDLKAHIARSRADAYPQAVTTSPNNEDDTRGSDLRGFSLGPEINTHIQTVQGPTSDQPPRTRLGDAGNERTPGIACGRSRCPASRAWWEPAP